MKAVDRSTKKKGVTWKVGISVTKLGVANAYMAAPSVYGDSPGSTDASYFHDPGTPSIYVGSTTGAYEAAGNAYWTGGTAIGTVSSNAFRDTDPPSTSTSTTTTKLIKSILIQQQKQR